MARVERTYWDMTCDYGCGATLRAQDGEQTHQLEQAGWTHYEGEVCGPCSAKRDAAREAERQKWSKRGPVPVVDNKTGRLEVHWPWDEVLVHGPGGSVLLHLEVMSAGQHATPWSDPPAPDAEGAHAHLMLAPDVHLGLDLESPCVVFEGGTLDT